MTKADLVNLITSNFNVEPLKAYIRETYQPNFKGRRDEINTWLQENLTIEQLKALIASEIHRFQLDISVFHLGDSVNFLAQEINQLIGRQDLLSRLNEIPQVYDTLVPDSILVGFVKVPVKGFEMRGSEEDDTLQPTGQIITVHYYVPFYIELLPPRYVKISLAKFEMSSKMIKHYSGTRLLVQHIDYQVQYVSNHIRTALADTIFVSGLYPTNLSSSVREFATQQRISALEFAWDDPDGQRYKKEGKKNQTLYEYSYVNGNLGTALDVGAAKWYLTNQSHPAEVQAVRELDAIRVNPPLGHIKIDKFQKETIRDWINEFILEAN